MSPATGAAPPPARAATTVWSGAGGWLTNLLGWLLAFLTGGALWLGWVVRAERHLTPETGAGYWLGVIGASAMLLLLIYPLRKRLASLRWIGSTPVWFRLHMALGLFGPAMILLHANFRLGSLNSAAALASMLVVMASGLVGRHLWGRLHRGVSGQRRAAREYLDEAVGLRRDFADILANAPEIEQELRAFEQGASTPPRSLISALARARALRREGRRLTRAALRRIDKSETDRRLRRQARREARRRLARYFAAVDGAASLAVFERLFALWHVLHLPLFVLLVVTAAGHVLAVHLY